MFLRTAQVRNRLSWLICATALVSGCGLQRFLKVEEVRVDQRLRFFLGGGGNSLALLHGRQAFLADVKFGAASRRLRHDLEDVASRHVTRVLLTHSHVDHAAGLSPFTHAGPVLVHEQTRRRLEAQGARAQWVEVNGPIELRLGDEVVRVWHPGVGHTDGDLVAYLVNRKLLMTGDLLTDGNEPAIDVAAGGDALALEHTLASLLGLDFVTVLPGHGPPVGRSTLLAVRDALARLEGEVAAQQRDGRSEDEVARLVAEGTSAARDGAPFASFDDALIRSMDRALRARKRLETSQE